MTDFALSPYRFSTDPPGMIALLETIGLRRVLSASDDSFAVLRGRNGYVALHSLTDPALGPYTSLNFAVSDVDAAADDLRRTRHSVTVWDETFGRQGGLPDPLGRGVWLQDAQQPDLYGGYSTRTAPGDLLVDVTVVYASEDFARDAGYFADFGFAPDPAEAVGDPSWCSLRTTRGEGVIGLASADADPDHDSEAGSSDNPVGPPVLVGLGFETGEPLETLARRLTAAGYAAEVVTDEAGPRVVLTDIDGAELEVFTAPA